MPLTSLPSSWLKTLCLGLAILCASGCDQLEGSIPHKSGNGRAHSPQLAIEPVDSNGRYLTQTAPLFSEPDLKSTPKEAIYTPATGTRERSELMDAIRTATFNDFGTVVVFRVFNLRADGEWAFAQLEPQHPDGRALQPQSTPFYRNGGKDGDANGLRVDVIWRKQHRRWEVHAFKIGASDAWWLRHCGDGPGQVIPGC